MGQSVFSFFLAVRFAGPFAGIVESNFGAKPGSAEGIAYFAIWGIVLFSWPNMIRVLMHQRSEKLRFSPGTASLPGKLGTGFLTAIVATGAIVYGLLLFPPIVGAFVDREAMPMGELDVKALNIYMHTANFFRETDLTQEELLEPREAAILVWGKVKMDSLKKASMPDKIAMSTLARKLRVRVRSKKLQAELKRIVQDVE